MAWHAVCPCKHRRSAENFNAASHARFAYSTAHRRDKCSARSFERVGDRDRERKSKRKRAQGLVKVDESIHKARVAPF